MILRGTAANRFVRLGNTLNPSKLLGCSNPQPQTCKSPWLIDWLVVNHFEGLSAAHIAPNAPINATQTHFLMMGYAPQQKVD